MAASERLLVYVVFAVVGAMSVAGCGSSSPKPAAPVSDNRTELGDDRPDTRRASAPDMDDDDDDDLSVTGLRGRLDGYDIEQGIKPHSEALTRCYTDKLGRKRYLGGEVEFAFVVGSAGEVVQVRLQRSDLGAWAMEQCLLAVARRMTFAKPKGGSKADFTLPLSFTARRPVTYWDEARADAEVGDRGKELAACADTASAPGEALVTVYVGARGQVQSVGFAAPSAPIDDAWAECAAKVIEAWTLTDPRGRVAKMTFRYPQE